MNFDDYKIGTRVYLDGGWTSAGEFGTVTESPVAIAGLVQFTVTTDAGQHITVSHLFGLG